MYKNLSYSVFLILTRREKNIKDIFHQFNNTIIKLKIIGVKIYMKAVILSGGRGTRLSPLTDKKPKPLVCVGNRSLIEILIERLASQGISECAVTLGYRGEDIKNALGDTCHGVKITYFEEKEPLGTAGAVKNCESFLDSDFIVLSGDSLCDIDLDRALESHRMSKSLATIVLTRSPDPLEYGVVLVDSKGNVTGFSEKPSWEGVKSDLVNCGIYLFKREVLDLIPEKCFWDFSSNLFPEMLDRSMPVGTFITHRFWCDVGNPWALYSCNMKTLSPDFFVRYKPKDLRISRSARVTHSVVGDGCAIASECEIKRAVIGKECRIGEGSEVVGCILGDRVTVGKGVRIERGAVIGDGSYISDNRLIPEGKRISADTRLEAEGEERSFTSACAMWHNGKIVFDTRSPEDFFSLGRAVRVLGERVGIMYSPSNASYLASTETALGLAWSGGEGIIIGEGGVFDSVFAAGSLAIPCLHFEESGDKIILTVTDRDSLPLSRKRERELSASFERPSSPISSGEVKYFDGLELLEGQYMAVLLDNASESHGRVCIRDSVDGRSLASYLPDAVLSDRGEFVLDVSRREQKMSLRFGKKRLDTEHLQALILKYLISRGRRRFVLPSSAPTAFDTVARASGCEILRACKSVESREISSLAMADIWARDVFFALPLVYKALEWHGFSAEKLERTVDSLPVVLCVKREVETEGVSVGRVMRVLERERGAVSMAEGVSLGGVRVIPDSRSRLRVVAEAASTESANELCDFAENIIKRIKDGE